MRGAKNVDRKLQLLKEKIKAGKLKKRLEKLGKSSNNVNGTSLKRKHDETQDDFDDILVMKKRHDWSDDEDDDEAGLPNVDINQVTASRSQKQIKIDGSSSQNKRIVFNDNGEEQEDDLYQISKAKINSNINISTGELAKANEDHLCHVKERLSATRDIDKSEEKECIHEKHKKQRMKAKADADAEEEGHQNFMVSLRSPDDIEDNNDDSSCSDDSNSDSDSDSSSSDDSDSDSLSSSNSDADVKEQEDLALALIKGNSS